MSTTNVAAVPGVGPGLGSSVARRFARDGFAVASMAQRADVLHAIEHQITVAGGRATSIAVDAVDANSVAVETF